MRKDRPREPCQKQVRVELCVNNAHLVTRAACRISEGQLLDPIADPSSTFRRLVVPAKHVCRVVAHLDEELRERLQ